VVNALALQPVVSFMRCESATRLLLNHTATARHRDADGMTALHLAVRGNYPDTVSLLVREEAWLDEQDGKRTH
jgi:ankyrin repeat protein